MYTVRPMGGIVGQYYHHRRYGLGRVLRIERGLFPQLHMRFEDGVDRQLELNPASLEARGLVAAGGGNTVAADDDTSRLTLVDGGTLEPAAGYGLTRTGTVFSMGYEGLTPEAFLETLQAHGVGLVVDIRDAPVSKRRGFGKRELETALRKVGIAYESRREWGNPKRYREGVDARKAPREALRRYTEHLRPQIFEAARYVESVIDRHPVFICYEAEPFHCHRSRFLSLVLPHCTPRPTVYHILTQ